MHYIDHTKMPMRPDATWADLPAEYNAYPDPERTVLRTPVSPQNFQYVYWNRIAEPREVWFWMRPAVYGTSVRLVECGGDQGVM